MRPIIIIIILSCIVPIVAAADELQISRVSLSTPGGSFDVKPGDQLRIDLRLENSGAADIQDIEVSAVFREDRSPLRDEDNDIVNVTTGIHVLRKSTSVERSMTFRVPYTVADAQRYTMELTARGYTANRTPVHATHAQNTFTINRLPHELVYQLLALSPSIARCGQTATLSFAVRNIGNANEDARFMVSQPVLSIQIAERFRVQRDYKKNNTYAKQFAFAIPANVEPKQYLLDTALWYDHDAEVRRDTLELVIACPSYAPAQPTAARPPVLAEQPENPPTPPQVPPVAQQLSPPPSPTSPLPRWFGLIMALVGVLVLILLALLILRLRTIRRALR